MRSRHVFANRHHGRDIDGACGQLAVKVVAASAKSGGDGCSSGANTGGDIEDLVPGGGSGRANGASRGRLGKAANGGKTGGGRRNTPSLSSRGLGPEDTIEISVEGAPRLTGDRRRCCRHRNGCGGSCCPRETARVTHVHTQQRGRNAWSWIVEAFSG